MSRKKKPSAPQPEWLSTSQLSAKYGLSIDFYAKLAKSDGFNVEVRRAGIGPKARIMFNREGFERWWNSRPGVPECQKILDSTKRSRAASGTRARDATGKNLINASIQKIKALRDNAGTNGSQALSLVSGEKSRGEPSERPQSDLQRSISQT